jgi:hypothetical protein
MHRLLACPAHVVKILHTLVSTATSHAWPQSQSGSGQTPPAASCIHPMQGDLMLCLARWVSRGLHNGSMLHVASGAFSDTTLGGRYIPWMEGPGRTCVAMLGRTPFSILAPNRARLVSYSCSVATGVGSLATRARRAYSANVPPSPWSSARSTISTYLRGAEAKSGELACMGWSQIRRSRLAWGGAQIRRDGLHGGLASLWSSPTVLYGWLAQLTHTSRGPPCSWRSTRPPTAARPFPSTPFPTDFPA